LNDSDDGKEYDGATKLSGSEITRIVSGVFVVDFELRNNALASRWLQ